MPLAYEGIEEAQARDLELKPILDRVRRGEDCTPYSVKNDVLLCKSRHDKKNKIVVPQLLIPVILSYFHKSPVGGHLGIYKTLHKVRDQFIWKGMDKDVANFVRCCKTCALSKLAQRTNYGLLASHVAERPMEKLFVDFVGKLPRSAGGNSFILTVVDAFSKFVWLVPVREATSKSAVVVLRQIVASFGCPRVVVTDNATQFTSREFKRFCFDAGVEHVTTVPYYPNPSQAERVNRNLKSALIAYHSGDHSRWDSQLHWLQFAFNSAKHEAHKETPFGVMMGLRPNCPLSNLWSIDELLPD